MNFTIDLILLFWLFYFYSNKIACKIIDLYGKHLKAYLAWVDFIWEEIREIKETSLFISKELLINSFLSAVFD